jgi:hypothetical protein
VTILIAPDAGVNPLRAEDVVLMWNQALARAQDRVRAVQWSTQPASSRKIADRLCWLLGRKHDLAAAGKTLFAQVRTLARWYAEDTGVRVNPTTMWRTRLLGAERLPDLFALTDRQCGLFDPAKDYAPGHLMSPIDDCPFFSRVLEQLRELLSFATEDLFTEPPSVEAPQCDPVNILSVAKRAARFPVAVVTGLLRRVRADMVERLGDTPEWLDEQWSMLLSRLRLTVRDPVRYLAGAVRNIEEQAEERMEEAA